MFCIQCGAQLAEGAKFCHVCGQGVAGNSTPSRKVKLTLDRASQLYLLNPPIKAVINGSTYVSIENGHTETVELDPGPCIIELSGSFRKAKLEFDLQQDTVVQLGFNRITGKLTASIKK